MCKKIVSFLIVLLLCVMSSCPSYGADRMSQKSLYKQFQNPTARYRPFVRWWWNGDAVEAKELIRELHLLKDAGIGGVEINPIELPSNADLKGHKMLTWLSDEWIDMLKTVFTEAEKIGMTCDLIVGSGWPFGSESLSMKERASVLLTYAKKVEGGKPFEISEFEVFKQLDPGVTVVNTARRPRIVSAYMVPDSINNLSEAIDITSQFKDGELNMEVPKGSYQFYAMVEFESFADVINGAPGAAGSILNHMDAAAVRRYLDHMSSTIEKRIGPLSKHLRAFFTDSMELEGTNWTTDFRSEFLRRRGYDVMPWLPFTMFKVGRLGNVTSYVFGAKKGPKFKDEVDRVRFDFELTKAELLLERFSATYYQWCKDQGVKSRAQCYGRGLFPLESSLGCDIPEGESWTTNYLRHKVGEEMPDSDYRRGRAYTMIDKYVSSAAHLTGKRLVSCEEMTNTYNVFSTSLEYLKVGSDMSASTGITHSVWHGFNYMPEDAKFPGWVQYGSYYNEHNTWWPYWKLLNDYRARMSSLLQNSDMVTDIAILPANADLWTELGVQTEPFPASLNVPYTSLIWEAIHKNGGGADYLSESIIEKSVVKNGKLCYGPKQYGVLFLPDVKGTTQKTLDKLLEFVKSGGRVFCIGTYPFRSLGLQDYEQRDAKVKATVEQMKQYPRNFILLEKPADDKYLEWYTAVMQKYQLPHAITITNPDRYVLQSHYLTDAKADIFFLVNANFNVAHQTDVIFPKTITEGRKACLYDANTGNRYALKLDKQTLHLNLGPSESYVIVFDKLGSASPWKPLPAEGKDSISVKNWKLSLHQPQEGWTKDTTLVDLVDLKDSLYKNFMGDITYTTTLHLDGKQLPQYLNLGKVCEIAEVKINGKEVGVRWYGRKIFDVGKYLHAGDNQLEVKVTTLMNNYMQTLKDSKVAQSFVIKRKRPLCSLGILGPVVLYR
jgi:hypothetical protein